MFDALRMMDVPLVFRSHRFGTEAVAATEVGTRNKFSVTRLRGAILAKPICKASALHLYKRVQIKNRLCEAHQ